MNKKPLKQKKPIKITDIKQKAYVAALERKITKLINENAELKVENLSLKKEIKRLVKIIKDANGNPENPALARMKAWNEIQKRKDKSTGESEQKPTRKVNHF